MQVILTSAIYSQQCQTPLMTELLTNEYKTLAKHHRLAAWPLAWSAAVCMARAVYLQLTDRLTP